VHLLLSPVTVIPFAVVICTLQFDLLQLVREYPPNQVLRMIYSTGGVERYIEHKQEVVTILVGEGKGEKDQNTSTRTGTGPMRAMKSNPGPLKRGVSYRSVKIIEGDFEEDEEEDEHQGEQEEEDRYSSSAVVSNAFQPLSFSSSSS
jgi:hypothetical protein